MSAELDALKAKAPEAAELLRTLGNTNRLLILCRISQGEVSVSRLEQDLGLKQPGLSQQLGELRQAGLVETRRESRSIFYSIADQRTRAVIALLQEIFCGDAAAVAERLSGPPQPAPTPAGDSARFARVTPRELGNR